MPKDYAKQTNEAVTFFKTDEKLGLTRKEAEKRLAENGENRLEGAKEKTVFQMLLDQFKDFLVIILIIAAAVSIILGEYIDGSIILLIVVLNSVLGVTQENKANNALKALKEMASPTSKVLRDGNIEKIASNQIVTGDIIILEAGDYVPADLRLLETINLKIDEAALTGESVPSEKDAKAVLPEDAGIGDRINSAFMSCVVTYGRGRGVVCGTGMNTEIGHIAKMLTETDEVITPLQQKLNQLGKLLGIVCLAVCAAIFAIGLLRGHELFEMFMTAVALAVAAIPEGLTVVVTVILAMGMQRMVKSNAIVKRLSAVETLGSTTVICSDKTGTLTQNKMTVQKLFSSDGEFDVTGTGYDSAGEIKPVDGKSKITEATKILLSGAALCNDAIYKQSEKQIIGDPTEGALIVAAAKYGLSLDELNKKFPREQEIPFDSDRKLMSTFHPKEDKNGIVMYTKGAPDEVLRRSAFIYKNGEIVPLTDKEKEKILGQNDSYARSALRVLGLAFKEMAEVTSTESEIQEKELIFVGLFGMIDPPREEVKDAIALCKTAGIGVKMITGDHKTTASAIGKAIGITPYDNAIEGRELSLMSDEQMKTAVANTSIFARVSPEHKVRLIEAVKANGNIASMTGDGVNDAPSLKRADIGVAMGITGTDVSKEAADMILTDDNFASIVKAIEEGRTIFENIRKVVGYLISCNIGEILLVFCAMIVGFPVPLLAIHLLSINLITDAFPAFALGMEKKEDNIMERKPRDPKEPIINKSMAIAVGIQSVALSAGALLSFIVGRQMFPVDDPDAFNAIATTMCFATLVIGELLRAYSARSEHKSIFKMHFFENSMLNKSALFSLTFLIITIYVPFLEPIFKTVALNGTQILVALGFAILPTIGSELAKKLK